MLAKSGGRQAKENVMRRKRLGLVCFANCARCSRNLPKARPTTDAVSTGAAKKEAGRAFGFVKISAWGRE